MFNIVTLSLSLRALCSMSLSPEFESENIYMSRWLLEVTYVYFCKSHGGFHKELLFYIAILHF